ncbi:2-amino-4-hydroxy-6-hydroxymethyldihydropteridine diphosphokinase [bacterium]|nr:2-amino-4-hydroxy-6-hydroxymethyldihydropteridine diphosphokinase [bacterium]
MSESPALVYLGLGSNLGHRAEQLARAALCLALTPGLDLVRLSPVYETAPWGVQDQPPFLNMVIAVRSALRPQMLLSVVKELERRLGRVPSERWGPRAIDIDLLRYGGESVDLPDLQLPHPRICERQFVLVPLAAIAPRVEISPGVTAEALADSEDSEVRLVGPLAKALRGSGGV